MDRSEHLVFEIGGDQFAVPVLSVEQAVSCEEAGAPGAKVSFQGCNVPVLCAHERFGLESTKPAQGVVILRTGSGLLALQVESIWGTRSFKDQSHLAVDEVFILNEDPAISGFFVDKDTQSLIVQLEPNGLQANQAWARAA